MNQPPERHLIESRSILREALLDIIATGAKNPKNLPATHMTHLAVNALKRDPLGVDDPTPTDKKKIFGAVDKPNRGG